MSPSFNYIDIVLLFIAVYFILLGLSRGFLRSIFGPIALIVGTWIAFLYYKTTQNAFIAISIGLFAPIIISLILRIFVGGWIKSLNPDQQPGPFSRLGGALITLTWGWIFVIFTVIFIDIFPVIVKPMQSLKKSINESTLAKNTVLPFKGFIIPQKKKDSTSKPADPKTLAKDPRIASLMNDPEIQEAAQKKDFAALLKNPKVMKLTQDMMSDPKLLEQMMDIYQQVQGK